MTITMKHFKPTSLKKTQVTIFSDKNYTCSEPSGFDIILFNNFRKNENNYSAACM